MLNITFRCCGYQWLYDRGKLHRRLYEAGFSELPNMEWRISRIPYFNNLETCKDSLVICEAQK